jgi:uncharacterized repeat protein (TIGR01451 family)
MFVQSALKRWLLAFLVALAPALGWAQCAAQAFAPGTGGATFAPFASTATPQFFGGMRRVTTGLGGAWTDGDGRQHGAFASAESWTSNSNSALVVSFSPPVPANWIAFVIADFGTNDGSTAAYPAFMTFGLAGGAITSDFALSNFTGSTETLQYNSGTGIVTRTRSTRAPGAFGVLYGTSTAMVSALSISTSGTTAGDGIGYVLISVPGCVRTAKISQGDTGGFTYNYSSNVVTPGDIAVGSETVTTTVSGTAATSGYHYLHDYGTSATLTETVPAGYILNSASCTDANSAITGSTGSFGSLLGSTITIPGVNVRAEADIVCTFTNTKQPILRLSKTLPNGRIAPGNQFTLNIAGTNGPASATTTGATNTPAEAATLNNAAVGASYVLSEVAAGTTTLTNYASSISCSNGGTGGNTTTLPSGTGTSFNVTPAAGDNISCVYSNAAQVADLSIGKSANPTSVISGGLVTYTLTVNNAGPVAANNSILRDAPGTDLDCTQGGLAAPTCAASGGAACPAGLTNAGLTGSGGVTIPTLPSGGGVVVTMQCRATASGVP